MEFSYSSYLDSLKSLEKSGYTLVRFCDYSSADKTVILRHDVDLSLNKALEMAKIEKENNIRSTYFVLISSNFYNLFSKENEKAIKEIYKLGHEIGLHFDITKYEFCTESELVQKIIGEIDILSLILGDDIKSFSWHIPNKDYLGKSLNVIRNNIEIINAYDPLFFKTYKYASDSMMRWRTSLEDISNSEENPHIQLLTHPIWYENEAKCSDVQIIKRINSQRCGEIEEYLNSIRPGWLEK